MIDINVTLLIQMVNFFVFLFLMNLILYRPIRRMVAERNALIESGKQGIEQADAAAAAAVAQFDESIQGARKMGREAVQESKDAAYKDEKAMVQEASEEAAKYVQGVRDKLRADVAAARKQLQGQVQAFSVDLAQKVLGRSI
ncbi:MAG: ATP synthase F0 subunit B [Syntrophobacteraceae bacterium]